MTILGVRDANPPYYFPDYEITEFRSPRRDTVSLPDWYVRSDGPPHDRIPVDPTDNDLNAAHGGSPLGQRIVLFGRVLDREGLPIPGALIEIWQVNGAGRYADPADPGFFPLDPNFTGSGRCVTDAEGRYRFYTLRPAAYPGKRGGLYRPSHIHMSVFGDDLCSRLITQCYFPDDPLLPRDPIVNAIGKLGLERLTARFVGEMTEPNDQDSALAYQYDIVLRGFRRAGVGEGEIEATPVGVLSASQTIGPLYGFALMFEGCEEAANTDDPTSVVVEGTVWDGRGVPVAWPECMIEIWSGQQFARTRTDRDGKYRAVLRRPPAIESSGEAQAPHFEVAVFSRGLLKQAQTRLYFPEETERNALDPVLNAVPTDMRGRLLAAASGRTYSLDIHLQGPNESVFFDF